MDRSQYYSISNADAGRVVAHLPSILSLKPVPKPINRKGRPERCRLTPAGRGQPTQNEGTTACGPAASASRLDEASHRKAIVPKRPLCRNGIVSLAAARRHKELMPPWLP